MSMTANSVMESSALNSHDMPTDYCYISFLVSTCYLSSIVLSFYWNVDIFMADSIAKWIKIIGTHPIYELHHFCNLWTLSFVRHQLGWLENFVCWFAFYAKVIVDASSNWYNENLESNHQVNQTEIQHCIINQSKGNSVRR